jgi:hypothetical protein
LTCTLAEDGTVAGAVYKPADVMVPHALPLHPEPLTDHVTAVFVAPETDAVNCCVELVWTLLLLGETATAITGEALPTCNCSVVESPWTVALRVTASADMPEAAFTVNAVVVPPACTTTQAGTETPVLLVLRAMPIPVLCAGLFMLRLQEPDPGDESEVELQERPVTVVMPLAEQLEENSATPATRQPSKIVLKSTGE